MEFANALRAAGAQPIFFPVIEIVPPDDFSELDYEIQKLDEYDWLIFTSVHGVEAFFGRLEFYGLNRIPPHIHVAAVGSKTARYLSQFDVQVNYVPDEYISEAMLTGFGANIRGKRFLLPQSNLARTSLAEAIRSAGGAATGVVAYHNIVNEPDVTEWNDLLAGVDLVTFTSPSTVRNFVGIVQKNGLDPMNLPGEPLFACIGPVTKQAAIEVGLSKVITAAEYTTAGLIEAIDNLVRT
jgi:uroporphyrinogen-III synthase